MPKILVIILAVVGGVIGLFLLYVIFSAVRNLKKAKSVKEEKHVEIKTPLVEEAVDKIKPEGEEVSFDEPVIDERETAESEEFNISDADYEMYEMPEERRDERTSSEEDDDADFERFRNQYCYSRIFFDPGLLAEIEGLSPELKMMVLGNFFGKIDSDY